MKFFLIKKIDKFNRINWNICCGYWAGFGEKISRDLIKNDVNRYFSHLDKKISYLEIGCGTGLLTQYIIKNYKENLENIYLTDISDEMIKLAKKRFENDHIEGLLIQQKNCYHINDENNKFDLIISCLLLHLLENKECMIKRIKKMLKKDGVLILSILAPFNENSFYLKINMIFIKYYGSRKNSQHNYFRLLEKNKMENYLKKHDLKLEKVSKEKAFLNNNDGELIKVILNHFNLEKTKDISQKEEENMLRELKALVEETKKHPLEIETLNYYVKKS